MRAFVKLRETLALHKELAEKLKELERKIVSHDAQIQTIFNVINRLMAPPPELPQVEEPPRKQIGFVREKKGCYRKEKVLV